MSQFMNPEDTTGLTRFAITSILASSGLPAFDERQIVIEPEAAHIFPQLPDDARYPEGVAADPASGDFFVATVDFGPNTNQLMRFSRHGRLEVRKDFVECRCSDRPVTETKARCISPISATRRSSVSLRTLKRGARRKCSQGSPRWERPDRARLATRTGVRMRSNSEARLPCTQYHDDFDEGINGADGVAMGRDGMLRVAANQSDQIFGLNAQGQVIASLGEYHGVGPDGSLRHRMLLLPASLVIVGDTCVSLTCPCP